MNTYDNIRFVCRAQREESVSIVRTFLTEECLGKVFSLEFDGGLVFTPGFKWQRQTTTRRRREARETYETYDVGYQSDKQKEGRMDRMRRWITMDNVKR